MRISKQVKVVTSGNSDSSNLLLVLHGYGQLANYFIRKFEPFNSTFFIVAPEGPHRFYLEGFSGRVGASWMTKELREWDIEDNMEYINQVIETYGKDKKITLLGFSQGGATAARYIQQGKYTIDHFILWASDFPEDVIPNIVDKFSAIQLDYAIGTEDVFFPKEDLTKTILKHNDLGFKIHTFEGKHDINPSTLLDVLNNR